jgi:hypothetical protein
MSPERRLDVREGRLESTILTRTFGIVALAALAVRRAGAFAAPKLVIPFSLLALVGCGHDGPPSPTKRGWLVCR